MSILSLDLGLWLGNALMVNGRAKIYGTHGLQEKKTRKLTEPDGYRFVKFRTFLDEMYKEHRFTAIAYEDVKNHSAVLAAHAYGGFKAVLLTWALPRGVPLHGYGVGQVKKSWTGNGNASKELMISTARKNGYTVADDADDTADALAIGHLAAATLEAAELEDAFS